MEEEEIKTSEDCPGYYVHKTFNIKACALGAIACQLGGEEPLENCEDYQRHLRGEAELNSLLIKLNN